MQRLRDAWRDHSLSISFVAFGTVLSLMGLPFREGTWFDYLSGFGQSFVTTGLGFYAGGRVLHEKNRPED